MTDIAAPAPVAAAPSKGLNIGLWIVQVLLGVAFLGAGMMKGFGAVEELHKNIPWTPDVPLALTRFIGISEALGAIGLLLPSITGIQPKLTVLAALGLVLAMVLAIGFHLWRGEFMIAPSFVLGALAAFVAWGRHSKAPIQPR